MIQKPQEILFKNLAMKTVNFALFGPKFLTENLKLCKVTNQTFRRLNMHEEKSVDCDEQASS